MIILDKVLVDITSISVDKLTDEYTLIHSEYSNIKERILVVIDERNSDKDYLRWFRGRLYAGPFNPLERNNQDDFFKILDNLHVRCGDWSVHDTIEITDTGRSLLSSIPYLFSRDRNSGEL